MSEKLDIMKAVEALLNTHLFSALQSELNAARARIAELEKEPRDVLLRNLEVTNKALRAELAEANKSAEMANLRSNNNMRAYEGANERMRLAAPATLGDLMRLRDELLRSIANGQDTGDDEDFWRTR